MGVIMVETMDIRYITSLVKKMYLSGENMKEMDAVDKYCEYLMSIVSDEDIDTLIDVISASQSTARMTLMVEPYDSLN